MKYSPTIYEVSGEGAGTYRFALGQDGKKMLFVLGLNPSTATKDKSDRTMDKILKITKECGYDGYIMFNLSSERATRPYEMSRELNSAMHRKNLAVMEKYAGKYPSADVLCAFGNGIGIQKYLRNCFKDIYSVLSGTSRKWKQYGTLTKWGNPRHPLYVRADGLSDFDIETYIKQMK